MNDKTILIVGHAEGGTCTTYDLTRAAVKAAGGELRSLNRAGEILNKHRFPTFAPFGHGIDPAVDVEAWRAARATLDRYRRGWIIKDVVNLGIVERYLREHPTAFHLLVVERDPRDVLATRLKNGKAAPSDPIVDPFAKARRLRELAASYAGAQVVEFPDVVLTSTTLDRALAAFGYSHAQHFSGAWLDVCRERLDRVAAARTRFAEQIELLAAGRDR